MISESNTQSEINQKSEIMEQRIQELEQQLNAQATNATNAAAQAAQLQAQLDGYRAVPTAQAFWGAVVCDSGRICAASISMSV